jgi:hypothetical protein
VKKILLTQGYSALVDDEDCDELSKHRWHILKLHKSIYAVRRGKKGETTTVRMHLQIMRAMPGQMLDHINGNGIDNRKINLRFCTHSQNHANALKTNGNKTSKYKGVDWHKRDKKWRASIRINYRKIHLGYFTNERDAAIAYNTAARILFGEFARLNDVREKNNNRIL